MIASQGRDSGEPTPTPTGAAPGEPTDAGDVVACPWCAAADVEQLSAFGPMHMTEQWYCRSCRSPFERIRLR